MTADTTRPVIHEVEAERLIAATNERWPVGAEHGDRSGFPKDSAELRAERRAEAQVHATLALAKQQRIANLIALWTVSEDEAVSLVKAGIDYGAITAELVEFGGGSR